MTREQYEKGWALLARSTLGKFSERTHDRISGPFRCAELRWRGPSDAAAARAGEYVRLAQDAGGHVTFYHWPEDTTVHVWIARDLDRDEWPSAWEEMRADVG